MWGGQGGPSGVAGVACLSMSVCKVLCSDVVNTIIMPMYSNDFYETSKSRLKLCLSAFCLIGYLS